MNAYVDLRGFTLVGVVVAWLVGILLGSLWPLPALALLIAAGATFVCLMLLWHNSQGRLIVLLIGCMLLGAYRYTSALPNPQSISTFIGSGVIEVRGSVSDEPKVQGRSRVLMIAVSSVSRDSGIFWQSADGELEAQTLGSVIENPYGPNYGDTVELRGKLQVPAPHSPPSVFASIAFPRVSVKGNAGNPIIAFLYHLRVMLATIISQSLPQPAAALLTAILLSLRTPALKPLLPAFNSTGTAHLIAPSGFKVTILAGLAASSTSWLSKKQRLFPAQRWLGTGLVIGSIVVYTILSGAGPAAIRAGVMGILLVVAPRLGRSYNIYTALALSALAMSMVDPFILWDTGFLLSFLGTLGIVLLTPLFQRLLRPIERLPFSHTLTEIIAVTLAAQTATLPIFAVAFNQISFVAPLANMLTVPLLSILLILGIVICATGLLFAPLAILGGWAILPLLWYMIAIVGWCANLPGAYIQVGSLSNGVAWCYYALLALVLYGLLSKWPTPTGTSSPHTPPLLSPRIWRIAQLSIAVLVIIAMGTTALASQPDAHLTVTFLDVGPAGQPSQGEAILIRTPEGKTVLIDGGLDAASLAQTVDSHLPPWQRMVDVVVLTSPRRDHLTGLLDIVSRYNIGEVVDAGMLHPTTTYALWRRTMSERHLQYVPVVQGATITIGAQLALQVLWPTSPLHKASDEARDNGLIVRLVAPGLRLLLLGATAQSKYALAGLMTDIASNYLQAEIVQIIGEVPFPSMLGEVLQLAHPSLVVITPGLLSAKQRKAGTTSTITLPASLTSSLINTQTIQTAQVGTIDISSGMDGWRLNM